MKKVIFYIITLAAVVACGLVEENSNLFPTGNEPEGSLRMITEVISGSHGTSTKATIADADASFKWSVGDSLAVHVSNGISHKYVTSKGASTAAATADFEVTYESGYERDAFAIYPSTIVNPNAAHYGQTGEQLDVTLPSSYTLAQVQGEVSPCPMIATNTTGASWTFYQICGLLRLTVNDIPSTAKRLDITLGSDSKICGAFVIDNLVNPITPGSSTIKKGTHPEAGENIISITKDGSDAVLGESNLVVNIPLPTGVYNTLTVTAYDATTEGTALITMTIPFKDLTSGLGYTASNEKAAKRSLYFSSSTAFRGYEVSAGILKKDSSTDPATYSLTAGAMVKNGSTYSLPDGCNPFEPAIYYNNSSPGVYFHTWNDATGATLPEGWRLPSGNANNTDSDWGKILFGAPLSTIMLNGNKVTSNAFAMVAVTLAEPNSYGVAAGTYNGTILLRDGVTIPTGYLVYSGKKNYTDNPLDEDKFKYLIQQGCLFISASGDYRSKGWENQDWGTYWSSTIKDGSRYYLKFVNTTMSTKVATSDDGDDYYRAVKLVMPLIP